MLSCSLAKNVLKKMTKEQKAAMMLCTLVILYMEEAVLIQCSY